MNAAPGLGHDLLIFLAVAAVIVPFYTRLHVSPVLGFLTAGVMLGPYGLGALTRVWPWVGNLTFNDPGPIARLGEFGVAFLLFIIGLELSWDRLVRIRKLVFGLGPAQVIVSGCAIGLIAYGLGALPRSAFVFGAALALSSTAIVLPSLSERHRLNSAAGRASFAILLFQDLAVAPLLFMLPLLAARPGTGAGVAALEALGTAVLAIAALLIAGRLVLRPLFHLVAGTDNRELFVAACLLVVMVAASVSAAAGQSMALGTFIAGLLLAETEYRREVQVTVEPFQGLLLGLFFVSVGARLDFAQILAQPGLMLGLVVGLIAVKMLVLMPVARFAGLPAGVSRELAFILAPAGEFALVLIGAAMAEGVVPAATGANAMIAATVSMFAIPILVHLSSRFVPPAGEDVDLGALMPKGEEDAGRVIIVGYGRVGELVGQMLARHQIGFLALDGNPTLVARERAKAAPIFYGDATRIELLRLCGIGKARALVVTMDDPVAVERVVAAARSERADITIVARARDANHAGKLYGLGVTDAVPETIEASLQLSEALLVDIGVPMGLVIASVHEKRDEFRALLQAPPKEGRKRLAIRARSRERE
jgi:CPA2 family monovalent cation:H+ antiporter-2